MYLRVRVDCALTYVLYHGMCIKVLMLDRLHCVVKHILVKAIGFLNRAIGATTVCTAIAVQAFLGQPHPRMYTTPISANFPGNSKTPVLTDWFHPFAWII